jgi:[acyl-carrier-protein] S-malonyltransferase
MKIVYMFPGQSSRYPEMIKKLLALGTWNGELLDRAAETLGRDLRAHFDPRNEQMFARNRDVQIGVFLANQMFCESLRQAEVEADLSLGLSLGEYNHLVHIGALGFEEALRLLEMRGRAYERGPEGAMASVFPIEFDDLRQVVASARRHGELEIAIRNAPLQHVIAGERRALEAALAILEEEHFVQGVAIENRIPMHTELFHSVAQDFRPALESVAWRRPRLPYLPNAVGRFVDEPTRDDFIELMARHVWRPVLWRESIDFLTARYGDPVFVEVGPRATLYNLLGKKWKNNLKYKTDSPDDLRASFQALGSALAAALGEELTDGIYRTPIAA